MYMLRKCIKKINSAIQWTKKCHFFHVLFIGPFILLSLVLADAYSRDYSTSSSVSCPNCVDSTTIYPDTPDFIATVIFFIIVFSAHICLIVAPFIEVLVVVIKAILRRKLCVEWNFLLNNKLYNIFYYFSVIFILTCVTYIYLPSSVTSYFSKFFQALHWVS